MNEAIRDRNTRTKEILDEIFRSAESLSPNVDANKPDGVKLTRMARNLESIKDYYDISGTNGDGLDEVIDFIRGLQ